MQSIIAGPKVIICIIIVLLSLDRYICTYGCFVDGIFEQKFIDNLTYLRASQPGDAAKNWNFRLINHFENVGKTTILSGNFNIKLRTKLLQKRRQCAKMGFYQRQKGRKCWHKSFEKFWRSIYENCRRLGGRVECTVAFCRQTHSSVVGDFI